MVYVSILYLHIVWHSLVNTPQIVGIVDADFMVGPQNIIEELHKPSHYGDVRDQWLF